MRSGLRMPGSVGNCRRVVGPLVAAHETDVGSVARPITDPPTSSLLVPACLQSNDACHDRRI